MSGHSSGGRMYGPTIREQSYVSYDGRKQINWACPTSSVTPLTKYQSAF